MTSAINPSVPAGPVALTKDVRDNFLAAKGEIEALQGNVANLAIGVNVQAWDAQLDDIAALTPSDSSIIVGNGTNWVAESGDVARASLGVGGLAQANTWTGLQTFSASAAIERDNFPLVLFKEGFECRIQSDDYTLSKCFGRVERTGISSIDEIEFFANNISLSGDANSGNDAQTKTTRIGFEHYTIAEEDVAIVIGSSTSAANNVLIGGGSSTKNAATRVGIYTAANQTTLTGTLAVEVTPSQDVFVHAGGLSIGDPAGATTLVDAANNALEVHDAAGGGTTIASIYQWSANLIGPVLRFQKSRNGTIGSHTALNDNDQVGVISFLGSDGTAFRKGATIQATIDGSVSSDDVPMDLILSTRRQGAAFSLPALRARANHNILFQEPAAGKTDGMEWADIQEVSTTDATPTTIGSITLDTNTAYFVEVKISVNRSNQLARGMYVAYASVYRVVGNAVVEASSLPVNLDHASLPATPVTFNASGNDIQVQVTGVAAQTFHWTMSARYMKIRNA
jgi:hypothetical protein